MKCVLNDIMRTNSCSCRLLSLSLIVDDFKVWLNKRSSVCGDTKRGILMFEKLKPANANESKQWSSSLVITLIDDRLLSRWFIDHFLLVSFWRHGRCHQGRRWAAPREWKRAPFQTNTARGCTDEPAGVMGCRSTPGGSTSPNRWAFTLNFIIWLNYWSLSSFFPAVV